MHNNKLEVDEALTLLKDFEKAKEVNQDSLKLLESAFGILDDLICENSGFVEKAKNLRKTYLKFLIEKLENTNFDFDTWADTMIKIVLEFEKEINETFEDAPDLKKSYSEFKTQQPWLDDVIKMLKRNL